MWLLDLLCGGLREKYEAGQWRIVDLENLLEAQRKISESYSLVYEGSVELQDYYRGEVDRLLRALTEYKLALDKSVTVPELPDGLPDGKLVDAYGVPSLQGYSYRAADYEYLVYPKEVWVNICRVVYPVVRKVQPVWVEEVGDCDDYASTFNAFVSLMFRESGLDKQGFFLTLWSRNHAYNGFVDSNLDVWVVEPQSGEVVGRIEDCSEPYVTRDVFLII